MLINIVIKIRKQKEIIVTQNIVIKQYDTMVMKIQTTSVTQSANEVLGTKEKKLYYLIIENSKGEKLTVNVGEKTHNEVMNLSKNDTPHEKTKA